MIEVVAFLNNPQNKLMHRDLRPSTIWVDTSKRYPSPKIYHIGFMQGCECAEPVECDGVWAAPEVICGGVFIVSDVWSIGSIAYKLAENMIIEDLKQELAEDEEFGEENRQLIEEFVDKKRHLFNKGRYKTDEYVPYHTMPAQEANNALAVAQMSVVAKDCVWNKQTRRGAVIKENYLPTFAKDQKVRQVSAYGACCGKLPWDSEAKGFEKNDLLKQLVRYGLDQDLADFIQSCWVFDCQKRPKAQQLLAHKFFQ